MNSTTITGAELVPGMTILHDGATAYRTGAVERNSTCVFVMLRAYGETHKRRFWNDQPVTLLRAAPATV